MTKLKTLDEAVALAMRVSNVTPLPELRLVADQLRAFRDSTDLNFDDHYQLMGAMNGVASCLVNHADQPPMTKEQLRKARKSDKFYALVF